MSSSGVFGEDWGLRTLRMSASVCLSSWRARGDGIGGGGGGGGVGEGVRFISLLVPRPLSRSATGGRKFSD